MLIDGELDNPLTRTGLRIFEQPLFGLPTADALTLNRGGRALSEAAVRLPVAMADTGRTLDVGALFGAMSGLVVVMGTKLDGSDGPFAHQSLLSARMGLGGIFAMYQPLSKLIHSVDAALDDQIQALLSGLLGQLDGVTNTDQVRDKALFLRRSAELSQVLLQVAPALGLTVTAVVDVTLMRTFSMKTGHWRCGLAAGWLAVLSLGTPSALAQGRAGCCSCCCARRSCCCARRSCD